MATKTEVFIHPLMDMSEMDPRDAAHLMAGEPFEVVATELNYSGKRYVAGEMVVLGKSKNDPILLKRTPHSPRRCARPEVLAYGRYEAARKSHERKVLEEARVRVSWAARDLNEARLLRDAANAQLQAAKAEAKNLERALKLAKENLAAGEAEAPVLEDFLPSTNGQK